MTQQPTGFQRLPRVAIAVMGGLGLLFVAAGPAAAQTCYPPGSPECSTTTTTTAPAGITVSDATIAPGQSVTFRVTGFRPGSTVTFTLDGVVIGTAVANDQGVATLTTTLPAGTAPGPQTIVATGVDPAGQVRTVSQVITATAPAASGTGTSGTAASGTAGGSKAGGSLAKTGAYAASTTVAGVGLVAGGVVLSRAAKRRKTSTG